MAESSDSELTSTLAWQRAHPEITKKFCGQWVALGPDGVLSHGNNLKTVLAEARGQGFHEPLLWKIPPSGVLAFWWSRHAGLPVALLGRSPLFEVLDIAFRHRQRSLYFSQA